jgi:hypothetical protein
MNALLREKATITTMDNNLKCFIFPTLNYVNICNTNLSPNNATIFSAEFLSEHKYAELFWIYYFFVVVVGGGREYASLCTCMP